ncbi:OsmC family protein [Pleionea sediminis]|uniref:OsmC family protein n=1 Tax=Pleionea sediminis TaxID=2569479 RepID=UPI0011853A0F|nr:OsmC family protein [Pleionea sediminis]
MSEYLANIYWERKADERFTDNCYSRAHKWSFDGGQVIEASASPSIVPLPYSVESHVDPEEAFVASLSSCHMLFFLSIAAKRQFIVNSYRDAAIGTLAKDDSGQLAMTRVVLRPEIKFSGNQPDAATIQRMHHQAHNLCFIANSVKTKVVIE